MNTDHLSKPLILLKGEISKLKCFRRENDFFLTARLHLRIGLTSTVATAMGMGSIGAGVIGMTGNSGEEADWVDFQLGEIKLHGWVWKMPLGTGDEVEVVGSRNFENNFTVYAIKRVDDDLLAIYPHATAGRRVHYRKTARAWIFCSVFSQLIFLLFFALDNSSRFLTRGFITHFLPVAFISCTLMIGLISYRVSRKFMVFVHIAEDIFKTFGWPDVENIDLRRTSRNNPGEYKILGFGHIYFRYKNAEPKNDANPQEASLASLPTDIIE